MRIGRGAAAAGAILTAVLLAGCAESGPSAPTAGASSSAVLTSPTPNPSGTAAICDDVVALQQSIAALQGVNVVQQGTDAARAALSRVQDDLDRLVGAAQTQSAALVARVESDVSALQAALGSAATTPPASTAASIRNQVNALAADTKTLMEQVSSGC